MLPSSGGQKNFDNTLKALETGPVALGLVSVRACVGEDDALMTQSACQKQQKR